MDFADILNLIFNIFNFFQGLARTLGIDGWWQATAWGKSLGKRFPNAGSIQRVVLTEEATVKLTNSSLSPIAEIVKHVSDLAVAQQGIFQMLAEYFRDEASRRSKHELSASKTEQQIQKLTTYVQLLLEAIDTGRRFDDELRAIDKRTSKLEQELASAQQQIESMAIGLESRAGIGSRPRLEADSLIPSVSRELRERWRFRGFLLLGIN
jgi:hypothetical protein